MSSRCQFFWGLLLLPQGKKSGVPSEILRIFGSFSNSGWCPAFKRRWLQSCHDEPTAQFMSLAGLEMPSCFTLMKLRESSLFPMLKKIPRQWPSNWNPVLRVSRHFVATQEFFTRISKSILSFTYDLSSSSVCLYIHIHVHISVHLSAALPYWTIMSPAFVFVITLTSDSHLNCSVLTFNAFSHSGLMALCVFSASVYLCLSSFIPCFVNCVNLDMLAEELATVRKLDFFWDLDFDFSAWEYRHHSLEDCVCARVLLSTHSMCVIEQIFVHWTGADVLPSIYTKLKKHGLMDPTPWSVLGPSNLRFRT